MNIEGLVEVRLRDVNDALAAPLTLWPMNDLDAVVRHVKHWGMSGANDATGQFVITDGGAYFEIVIE